jgi:myxalamid-type polyketide synthase MxaB
MQALPQDGEMVALLASESQAQEAIAPYSTEVSIAAINAPNSVVISGQRKAINAICATLEASGIKTKKLNVSHAFHSPLMSPMLGEFERVARQVNFSTSQIKLISNVTGKEATLEIATPDYWCRHIRQPVRFARCIESLEQQEIDVFVEIGAKPILLGMARQCLPEHLGLWLTTLRPGQEDWQELLSSLAQLYVHGVPIDWLGFNLDYTRRRVRLPTYPFQRQRYWVEAPKDNGTQALALANNLTSPRQHPLLGQKLCLLGTKQIRFQSQISKNFPNWLQDHRVFETTIVPGTAYIEMALAAGVAVGKTENITVEDVIIQKALILPDDGSDKIIQLVLTPQLNLSYTFEIFSLETTPNEDNEEPQGILHASGTLLVKDNQYPGETIDLATLKSQCQEEVSPEILYQRNEKQNINYGESFRALDKVWRQGTVALGKISLPEKLRTQVGEYQLHPVLLDASLQVLDATFLEDGYENTYVPVGVERLLFYTRPSADIWCYAQLCQGEDRSQKTISADFRLFAEDGELIALVEGFQLKHAPRDAMLGTQEKSWQDWLYEVEWRLQRQDNPSQDQTQSRSRDSQKPRNWLIFADGQGTGQQLSRLLHSQGDNCTIIFPAKEYEQIGSTEFRIDPANPSHFQQLLQAIPTVQGVVHLWSLDAPEILSVTDLEKTSLTNCGSTLHLVQALVNSYTEAPRLWLVTRGAQAVNGYPVEQVAQSPLWGMGKVIALEHPELKCVRVDLDPIATGNDTLQLFEEIISSLSPESTEDQVAFRDRARYVPRLVYHRQSQKTLGQTQLDVPENQPFRLEISSRGSLDNLKLQATTRQKPKAGEIEIRVHSTGLNFRDVLNALSLYPGNPPLGIECAGEVVALGEGVKGFELGESVLGLASGSFSQYVTVDANFVVPKPAALTFEEAATIPEAFFTAYWCLHHVAKISAGDRVLIHAAAGGVGQAAVQLAIGAGAQVFATASPSKWPVLKSQGVKYIMNSRTLDFAEQVMAYTNGQGVDIVLNSLTGEGFVERSLAVVAAKGRFVELAKRDIWNSEQVALVRPDVQYFAIDMGSVCQEQPTLVQSMLRQLIQRVENGSLLPLPQTVFPLIDAVSAFRYMQQAKHIGKIVIKFPDKIGTQERLSLRSDGTYLITGGLGGLGLLVAQWLVERGAKHLVLLSRSGLNPSASEQLERLEQAGACITAGILDDGVLLQLHWQRFASVMAPKVQGAWNLHRLTQNKPIDFFVLFSSSSSLLGTGGQPNYAAANAFLDALASYRRMLGLPGLSINWGTWAEVGMTARLGLVEQLNRKGEESIPPQQGLQVLEQLLLNPPVQVGVMPVNWSRFLQQRRVLSPFFTDFLNTSFEQSEQRTELEFRKQLETAPALERKALLVAHVKSQVAQVLGWHSSNSLDFTQGFFSLGMDSLTSIELRSRLQSSLACSLPSTIAFDYPTVEALVNYLLEKVLPKTSTQESNESNQAVSSTLTEVQELSESEAEALLLQELENLNY